MTFSCGFPASLGAVLVFRGTLSGESNVVEQLLSDNVQGNKDMPTQEIDN
jgi:hypothetical protein